MKISFYVRCVFFWGEKGIELQNVSQGGDKSRGRKKVNGEKPDITQDDNFVSTIDDGGKEKCANKIL